MDSLTPVFKWAGGKRWLVGQAENMFPHTFRRLVEPFAGSAAVFFRIAPPRGWLNDINHELMETYSALADNWKAVAALLKRHQNNHSHDYYYEVRGAKPISPTSRAARLIYLNRTCFNGLYRVNLKGEFNVPIGTKSTVLLPSDNFSAVSELLRKSKLTSVDFEEVIDKAKTSDFLFVDPPYTVRHNLNGFIKYNERLFSWSDQIRLRDALFRARSRGVHIVLTNADHESIRDLYRDCISMNIVTRQSVMAASSAHRKLATELLILV